MLKEFQASLDELLAHGTVRGKVIVDGGARPRFCEHFRSVLVARKSVGAARGA